VNPLLLLIDDASAATGGGIASWALHLCAGFEARGIPIDVYAKRLPPAPYSRSHKGAVRFHAVRGRDWNRYRGLYMALALLPVLARGNRPVVIASTWQHAEGLALLRRAFPFILICFAHGTDITRAVHTARTRRLRRVLEQIDLFVPVSRFLERLVRDLFPGFRFPSIVIPNGMDAAQFRPLPGRGGLQKRFGIDPGGLVVLSVGRTIEAKGFRTAVRAIALVRERFPSVRLLIAGAEERPEIDVLKSLIRRLRLEGTVRFLSAVPYPELPALYNACDVFILASRPVRRPYYQEDNFPMALLEAGACGLPSVATKCGGIPEIVKDGATGFVVPPGDENALAEKIKLLLRRSDLRRKMGRRARRRITERFTFEIQVTRLLDALKELT
jgi:glycosyltransferase involved in cell wall biosynthesis